jgi:hypothetical protein
MLLSPLPPFIAPSSTAMTSLLVVLAYLPVVLLSIKPLSGEDHVFSLFHSLWKGTESDTNQQKLDERRNE